MPLTTIILPSEVITATVPENRVKDSISQTLQTENFQPGKEMVSNCLKKKRKKVGELRFNTAAAHKGENFFKKLVSILP